MRQSILSVILIAFSLTALAADPPNDPVPHKPIVVEVKHATELAEVTLRGIKSIPKVAAAAEFVGNALSAYRVFRAAGKGARFGGTVLSKLSPAGPFITAWFAANAPLEIREHHLNKLVAAAALKEEIAKVDRLLSLNGGNVEIVYDGQRYKRDEVIAYFKKLQSELQTADPTDWDGVVEAVKAAVPIPFLFENDTAEREQKSAAGQMLLAQAIQDLIAVTAPKILDEAMENEAQATLIHWTQAGEDARRRFFDGIACNIYVICKETDLDWSKHTEQTHGKMVSLRLPGWEPQNDPTGERRFRGMQAILTVSGRYDRQNWGCMRDEFFGPVSDAKAVQDKNDGRVFSVGDDAKYLYSDGFAPTGLEVVRAIHRACSGVRRWDGRYYVRFSAFQVAGTEPFRDAYGTDANKFRSLMMDTMMANPLMPKLMSESVRKSPKYTQFQPPPYEPPQMRAR